MVKSTGLIFQDFSIAGILKQWEWQNRIGFSGISIGNKHTNLYHGKKSVTRRTRGLNEINENPDKWQIILADDTKYLYKLQPNGRLIEFTGSNDDYIPPQKGTYIAVCSTNDNDGNTVYKYIKCPWGKTGDEIWVKETFHACKPSGQFPELTKVWYNYKADHQDRNPGPMWPPFDKWKSPVFMPKEASRILLEITALNIERLQDITEDGAVREGMIYANYLGSSGYCSPDSPLFSALDDGTTAKQCYQWLWEKIHGKGSWDKNPWVWVIQFKVKSVKP
jgi:hypothetical protein